MANIFLRPTAQFRPFSYQEMLAPVKSYTDAYNSMEQEMSNLDIMAANIAGKLTSSDKDSGLRTIYNQFNSDMDSAMNDFYKQGYNSDTKKKLNALRVRYSEKLDPINEAYKLYQEDQKYITRMKREHPEYIMEGYGDSVSDYMNGNIPSGISANLDDTFNKALKDAAGASNRFVNNITKPTGILGNQYYQFLTKQGISQDAIDELNLYLNNPAFISTEEGKALYDIVEKQRIANNYYDFKDSSNRSKIDAAILNGIFAGVSYKENIDRVSNKDWKATPQNNNTSNNANSGINTVTIGSITTDKTLGKQAERDIAFSDNIKTITDNSGNTRVTSNALLLLEQEINDLRTKWSNAQTDGTSQSKRLEIENAYNARLKEYEKLNKEFNVEFKALNDKYSYLNLGEASTNINLGARYDDARSKEQVFIGDLQYSPTEEKKLDESVKRLLTGLSDNNNVGIFNRGETNSVSQDKANELLENSQVIVSSDEGIVLKTNDGIKTIKGIDNVDAFNASYKATTNFLKDYTKEGLQNTSIGIGSLEDIQNMTIEDINALIMSGNAKPVSNESGDTFFGITIKDPSVGDIYKVLIHNNGFMAISSLNDIIQTGGVSIRDYQEKMLTRGLKHYFDINTREP